MHGSSPMMRSDFFRRHWPCQATIPVSLTALGGVAARPRWNQPFVLEAIEAKGIVRFSNLVARKDMIRDLRSALHP